jgi:hypothetical protein
LPTEDKMVGTNVVNNVKPTGPSYNNINVNVDKAPKGEPMCKHHPWTKNHTTDICFNNKRSNRDHSLSALNYLAQ